MVTSVDLLQGFEGQWKQLGLTESVYIRLMHFFLKWIFKNNFILIDYYWDYIHT